MMDEKRVVDWFAEANINIDVSSDQSGLFTPNHEKYDVDIAYRGEEFHTTFQCNPAYMQPEALQVMDSVVSDAESVAFYTDVDDFAEELGFTKPSEAIRAWNGCKEAQEALGRMGWPEDDLSDLREFLEEADFGELGEKIAARKVELDMDTPEIPDGWRLISDVQAELDTGEIGDQLAGYDGYICDAISEVADSSVDIYTGNLKEWISEGDNFEWLETAKMNGLLEGVDDYSRMIMCAQYECYTQDLYDHMEDNLRYAIFDHLKDKGAYAVSEDLVSAIMDIDCSDNNDYMGNLYDQADRAEENLLEEFGEKSTMTKEEVREAARGEQGGDSKGFSLAEACKSAQESKEAKEAYARSAEGKGYDLESLASEAKAATSQDDR